MPGDFERDDLRILLDCFTLRLDGLGLRLGADNRNLSVFLRLLKLELLSSSPGSGVRSANHGFWERARTRSNLLCGEQRGQVFLRYLKPSVKFTHFFFNLKEIRGVTAERRPIDSRQ